MSDALAWAIFGATIVALAVFLVILIRERRVAEQRFLAAMRELTGQMAGLVEELRAGCRVEPATTNGAPESSASSRERSISTRSSHACSKLPLPCAGSMRRSSTIASAGDEKPTVATSRPVARGGGHRRCRSAWTAARPGPSPSPYEYPAEAEHERQRPDPPRRRQSRSRGGRAAVGYLDRLQPGSGPRVRRAGEALARGSRDSRGGPAIENARRLPRSAPAGRPRCADRSAQPPLLPRDAARVKSRVPRRYDRHLRSSFSICDGFKAINDRIGHLAGDGVLAEVAERVRSVVRSADVACRRRRRRVRDHPPGVRRSLTPSSCRSGCRRPSPQIRSAKPGRSQLSAGAAELRSRRTTRRASSSGPTTRSIERSKPEASAAAQRPKQWLQSPTNGLAGSSPTARLEQEAAESGRRTARRKPGRRLNTVGV